MRPASDLRLFLLVALLVLLSRLPFLGAGYGSDPDAWRVAWAARVIASTGHYEASRFPGYPLHEYACALLQRGGPFALDLATAVIGALGAGCFALALRTLGSRDALLAGLALASAPAIYLASVTAMDYVWALGFALAALLCALRGRALAAGGFAGLAVASRLTSLAWLVPLAFALAHACPPGARMRPVAKMTIAALAIGALAFIPVILTYGPGFFRFYEHGYPAPLLVIKNATVDVWGIPGFAALAVVTTLHLIRGSKARGERSIPGGLSPMLAAAWTSGLVLYLISYLRLPIKAVYVIPVVPFAMLALGATLGRRGFVAICVALIASPWVLKVEQPDPARHEPAGRAAIAFRALGRPFVLRIVPGPVLVDRARRIEGMRYVERSLERARALGRPAVVAAYDWLPQIRVRLGGKVDGTVEYLYVPTAEELLRARERGTPVYYMSGADWEASRVNGVDLNAWGARPLDTVE